MSYLTKKKTYVIIFWVIYSCFRISLNLNTNQPYNILEWLFVNSPTKNKYLLKFYIYLGHVWISGTKYTVYFEFIYLHFFKRRKLDINYKKKKKCFVDIIYGWVNLIVFALKFKICLFGCYSHEISKLNPV